MQENNYEMTQPSITYKNYNLTIRNEFCFLKIILEMMLGL